MKEFEVEPTSQDSARCDPIILRQTETTRLVFLPSMVNNVHDESAAVKGTFVYQRQGPNDEWDNVQSINLSSLKAGEGVRLRLKSEEVLDLVNSLRGLYSLHEEDGVPDQKTVFIKTDVHNTGSLELDEAELRNLLDLIGETGANVVSKIVEWCESQENIDQALHHVENLEGSRLETLNTLAGIGSLRKAYSVWEDNQENGNEEFWRQTFIENAFVISQVFSFPAVIVDDEAYVGGKSVQNTGGNVVDFLFSNELTHNSALIEIKTPQTSLVSSEYRSGVHKISQELTGALVQLSNYKDSLSKDFYRLANESEKEFESFDPNCLLIVGNTQTQLDDQSKTKSFELFRNGLSKVDVITYDELFGKVKTMIDLLEGGLQNEYV
jgi:hypothetical protein